MTAGRSASRWFAALSPTSLVVSLLALTLVVGGTAYAREALPKRSVGTQQLRNDAVVTAKVKDGTLRASDFHSGVLPDVPDTVELRAGFDSTGTAPAPITVAGLRMTASCSLGGAGVFVRVRTTPVTAGELFDVAGVRTLGTTTTAVFSQGVSTYDVVAQPAGPGQEARAALDAVLRTPDGTELEAQVFVASLASGVACHVWALVTPTSG